MICRPGGALLLEPNEAVFTVMGQHDYQTYHTQLQTIPGSQL